MSHPMYSVEWILPSTKFYARSTLTRKRDARDHAIPQSFALFSPVLRTEKAPRESFAGDAATDPYAVAVSC